MHGRRLSGSLNSPVTLNRDCPAEDPVFLGNSLHHFPYSENIHPGLRLYASIVRLVSAPTLLNPRIGK